MSGPHLRSVVVANLSDGWNSGVKPLDRRAALSFVLHADILHRAPTPNILSNPSIPSTYTRDNVVTRSGSTVTLGPFHDVPPTLASPSSGQQRAEQVPCSVHYEYKEAVMALRTLRRGVEVSHWGANVNVQDEMDLVNIGPK